jgi:hypothetical protein
MSEKQSISPFVEHDIPKEYTTALSLRDRLDRFFHPVSTARMEQFREILSIVPEGNFKKTLETIQPRIREILKPWDRTVVMNVISQRVFVPAIGLAFAGFGVGFSLTDPFAVPVGVAIGTVGLGIAGTGFIAPTEADQIRSKILEETVQGKAYYGTEAGKNFLRSFDAKDTHQNLIPSIVSSITQRNFQNLPGLSSITPDYVLSQPSQTYRSY